jgi:predicted ferric reductase
MKKWILGLILVPLLLWFCSVYPDAFADSGIWAMRREGIVMSGVLAYAMMSFVVVLATRPAWLEQKINGMDKGYRLHKWAGIGAGLLFFSHWMIKLVPKWIAGWGWIAAKPSNGGGHGPASAWISVAKDMGEWMAYLMLVMIAIALLRMIPYHWFRKIHRLFAVAFLAVTYHAVMLMPTKLWLTPLGVLIALCALAGSAAALLSLSGLIGRRRQVSGRIGKIDTLSNGVLEIECRLDGKGLAHRPGQFAYLRFDDESAHPFTIASSAASPDTLRFAIKPLGDYTQTLAARLHPGQALRVEGPYGRFDFAGNAEQQIWVAGGICVTPFLSRLESLAKEGVKQSSIVFFYCTSGAGQDPYVARLQLACMAVGVRLEVVDSQCEGHLNFDRIAASMQQPRQAELWFCGPAAFGDSLKKAWQGMGLSGQRFHREYFAMR